MKTKIFVILVILCLGYWQDTEAQTGAESTKRMMMKDGKLIPAPASEIGTPPVTSNYFDWEGFERSRKQDEEMTKKYGWPKSVWQQPEPLPPGQPLVFEVPQNETLEFCDYTASYSFPEQCDDGEGNIIFTAGKDPQSVLDAIKAKQGKNGPYNIVPSDYKHDPIGGIDESPLTPEEQAKIEAAKGTDDGWTGYPRENMEGTPLPR